MVENGTLEIKTGFQIANQISRKRVSIKAPDEVTERSPTVRTMKKKKWVSLESLWERDKQLAARLKEAKDDWFKNQDAESMEVVANTIEETVKVLRGEKE